jgi:hypothetical protein
MKFRKKPVVIDAIRVSEVLELAVHAYDTIPSWVFGGEVQPGKTTGVILSADHIDIVTFEGTMRAESNDWIIRGVKGELYPCKPDIFDATYEPAH